MPAAFRPYGPCLRPSAGQGPATRARTPAPRRRYLVAVDAKLAARVAPLRIVLLQHYLVENRTNYRDAIGRGEDQDGLPHGQSPAGLPIQSGRPWAAKGGVTRSGYKLHVTETSDDPPRPRPTT